VPERGGLPRTDIDDGEAAVGGEEPLEHGPGGGGDDMMARGVPVPDTVCPRVAMAGNKLVDGLEKKACVLSFQISDAQAVLLLESVRNRMPVSLRGCNTLNSTSWF
jgi:hypothetical protein